MRHTIVPLSLALAVALPAAGQSLGEVAAKERERREKLRAGKPAAKVITEEDLRSSARAKGTVSQPAATDAVPAEGAPSAAPAEAGAAAAAPAPAAPAGPSQDEQQAQRQQQWRERMRQAQAQVNELSARVEELQFRLNDVSGNIYSSSRANMVSELEAAKTLLATARGTLATLEEEGRRNGYQGGPNPGA